MKKLLSIILVGAMIISLIACAKKEAKVDTTAVSTTLVMATNAEFPPYEFKEDNQFKGIDVEVAGKIAEKLGTTVEILDIAFDSIIPSVMSGKADFGMAGMTVTEDRKQSVDFSNTYQTAVQAVIVPANSDIADIEGLTGKKIGVQLGTTGDIYCTDDFGDENISRYPKIVDGVQAMKSGMIDACVVDDQVAKAVVAQDEGSFKILNTPYAEEEYAIAVKKGNLELLNKINAALDEMKNSGELAAIISKYIN